MPQQAHVGCLVCKALSKSLEIDPKVVHLHQVQGPYCSAQQIKLAARLPASD